MLALLSVVFQFLSAAIVITPLLLLLNIFYIKDIKKTAFYFVYGIYICGVFAVVGVPTVTGLTVDLEVNIVPLVDIVSDLKNAILNVILFIPLGFLLTMFTKKFREAKYMLSFGFGMSAAIEILQIFTYRLTDINDLITNTLGTAIGYFIAKIIIKKAKKPRPIENADGVYPLTAAALAVMFAAVPFITPLFWKLVP